MIALDEDALICDFAETYHIYDIYSKPIEYIAILAYGLRDNSRIKMKASGISVDIYTLLLAHIADNTAINVYAKTKDAQNGRNKPKSMLEALTHDPKKEVKTFENGQAFLEEWRRLNGN